MKLKNILLWILIIILGAIIVLKFIYLRKYKDILNDEYYSETLSNLSNIEEVNIVKTDNKIKNYFEIDNIKIRNDFKGFAKIDDSSFYYKEIDGKKVAFAINIDNTLIDGIKINKKAFLDENSYNIFEKIVNKYLVYHGLDTYLDNNFKSDIDYFKYLANKEDLSLFNTLYRVLNSYNLYLYGELILPNINEIKVITGDYDGYILIIGDGTTKEVNIIWNNKRYVFTFVGDYFTESYVEDIIRTIEID